VTRCHLLSVPGPVATQRHLRATIHVRYEPPCACRCQDQTQRVSASKTLPLPTVVLPEPVQGVTVTDGHFYGPAVAVLAPDLCRAQRQIRGEKGFDGWGWVSWSWSFGSGCARPSQPHAPYEVPRQYRVPPAIPGLELGPRFAGMGCPSRGGLGQGLGRAEQVAFFAGGTTPRGGMWGRHLVELGADGEAPDNMHRLGHPTDRVLGGRASISQALDGPPRSLRGHAIEEVTGQRTAGPIRHIARVGLRFFAIEFEANRHAEAVPGPTLERSVPDAQDDVHPPQRTVCWSGGTSAMAVTGEPFDMRPRFFLGRIVEADAKDFACGDQRGR
jgi:hypothetical protein